MKALNLTDRQYKAVVSALKSVCDKDDGIFFDLAVDCYGLRGVDYKDALKAVRNDKKD